MQLCETIDNLTGARRYYRNGIRCTRDRYESAKFGRRLDCFHTITRGNLTSHHCSATSIGN